MVGGRVLHVGGIGGQDRTFGFPKAHGHGPDGSASLFCRSDCQRVRSPAGGATHLAHLVVQVR